MTGFESQMNKFNHTSISLGVQIEKLYSSDVDNDNDNDFILTNLKLFYTSRFNSVLLLIGH